MSYQPSPHNAPQDGPPKGSHSCSAGNRTCRWSGSLLAVGAVLAAVLAMGWSSRAADTDSVPVPAQRTTTGEAPSQPAVASKPAEKATWHEDFETALAAAQQQKKPILMRFTATWCVPCRVMDSSSWPDDQVQALLSQKFIPLKVDIDQADSRELVRRYGIYGVPTLVVIDSDGQEIERENFLSAAALRQFLEEV